MLNTGSTAFITCVIPCSRHSRATAPASEASIWAPTNRSSTAAARSAFAAS